MVYVYFRALDAFVSKPIEGLGHKACCETLASVVGKHVAAPEVSISVISLSGTEADDGVTHDICIGVEGDEVALVGIFDASSVQFGGGCEAKVGDTSRIDAQLGTAFPEGHHGKGDDGVHLSFRGWIEDA